MSIDKKGNLYIHANRISRKFLCSFSMADELGRSCGTPCVTASGECGIVFNADSQSLMLNIPLTIQLPLRPIVELLLKLDQEMAMSRSSHDFVDRYPTISSLAPELRRSADVPFVAECGDATLAGSAAPPSKLSADAPVFTPSITSSAFGSPEAIASINMQAGPSQCNQM
jgi:hypothetical protein